MRIVVIASCLLAGCAGAPAEEQPISTIGIDHMVIPAVPEVGGPVAAYAGFDNRGSEDHLLGIDCTCAASVELHQVIRNGGQVSMTNTFPLALPMGRTEVKPPGVPLHFMLIGTSHHKHLCRECAEICEECARSCEQVGDMQECVDACRRCAESCRKMAA